MPKFGAHVSAAISLDLSFERAQKIGATCTQIFISPPQQWLKTPHNDAEIEEYRKRAEESGVGPNFVHGTYLMNLATTNLEHLQKSIDWLVWALNMCGQLSIEGVIFHIGSHKGTGLNSVLDQVIKSIVQVLQNSNPSSKLILENSAGMGGSIGSKFSDLGKIIKAVKDPRVMICLDTQHSYAASYDVKTPIGLRTTLEEFEEEVGLNKLVAVHCNDSKVDLGGGKDRHENIGEGFIGREGFQNIVNHKAFKDMPFLLEVPGFNGMGPDTGNIDILKSLVAQ